MIVDASTKRIWQVKEPFFIFWLSDIGGEVCDE